MPSQLGESAVGMSLMKRFYADRFLQIRSFSFSLCVSVAHCAALYFMHAPEFYSFHFHAWYFLLMPVGIYIGGLSAVFIHNASHGSFPNRWLNELCGQASGIHQLWGFTGWKLIHLIHHHYSDKVDMDPHAPSDMSFWHFARVMFVKSSRKVSERYRDHFGTSTSTKVLQRSAMAVFFMLVATNLTLCYLLLGPAGFLFFYIPSYVANHLLFVDINYTAHPKDDISGETAAANLDNTLYYKLANALWCGIYYHANHHRKPLLFNPKHMVIARRERSTDVIRSQIAA